MRRPGLVALIALAALLTGAAGSAQAERLVSLGTAGHQPYSDGHRVVWDGGAGLIRTLDPLTGRQRTLAADPGCRVASAGSDLVGIACPAGPAGPAHSYLIDLTTGVRTPLAVVQYPMAVGSQWVEEYVTEDCYHCEQYVYRNWHTGEVRQLDGMDDEAIDLDSATFRSLPLGLYWPTSPEDAAALGSRSLVTHSLSKYPYRQEMVLVIGGQTRVISLCKDLCGTPVLTAHRVTWTDIDLDRGIILRSANLQGGARRAWRVANDGLLNGVSVLSANDATVLVKPPRGRTGMFSLYRAAP